MAKQAASPKKKASPPRVKKISAIKTKASGTRGFAKGVYLRSGAWSAEWEAMIRVAGSAEALAEELGVYPMKLNRWASLKFAPKEHDRAAILAFCKAHRLVVPALKA